jgi:gas vesicle structural protein
MPVERTAGGSSLIDVLDRVLDKGIVIDAWVRVSLVGIDLVTVEARVVVASIDTYLKYSEAVGQMSPSARPGELPAHNAEALAAENVALRAELAGTKQRRKTARTTRGRAAAVAPRQTRSNE